MPRHLQYLPRHLLLKCAVTVGLLRLGCDTRNRGMRRRKSRVHLGQDSEFIMR